MKNPMRGGYTVKYDADLNPVVTLWGRNGEPDQVLSTEEGKRFLKRGDAGTAVLSFLMLPVSAVFWVIVGINRATEWILERIFR